MYVWCITRRSQCPRGLRRRSTAARLLRLWVRIPPGAWMSFYCECCVLSGKGLCDALFTRPEESYRLWCGVVCDLESSRMRRSWPALGRSATGGWGWGGVGWGEDALYILSPHSSCRLVPSGWALQRLWNNTERFNIYPVHRRSTWQFGYLLSSGRATNYDDRSIREDAKAKTGNWNPQSQCLLGGIYDSYSISGNRVSWPKCQF